MAETRKKPNYSGDLWNIPASDEQGHNDPMTIRLPPGWLGQIQRIIESKVFGYGTSGHLGRHAIIRHLIYLESLEDIPKSTIGQIRAAREILEYQETLHEVGRLMPMLKKTVDELKSDDENGKHVAVGLIFSILDCINEIPNTYWRKRLNKQIRDKYGDMLADADTASLTDFAEDDE